MRARTHLIHGFEFLEAYLFVLPRGIKEEHTHDGGRLFLDSSPASWTNATCSVPMSTPVTRVLTPIEGRVVSVPSDEAIDEKIRLDKKATEVLTDDDPVIVTETKSGSNEDSDSGTDDAIIVTGADAAKHLLPMRDDLEPALTFRSLVLATILSAFQAVMYQIYYASTVQCHALYHESMVDVCHSRRNINIANRAFSSNQRPSPYKEPLLSS